MAGNLILDIVILLAAAVVVVPLCRMAGLGTVPGFLIAGVAVGPSGLGWIDNVAAIAHMSELGVVVLLFIIGIELKPARLWLMRRLVFGLGALQVVVTGALITAAAVLAFDVPFRTAVIVGPALALSSTAFVLQLLSEQRTLHTEVGRSSIAVLLLQDLAVVPLLALVPLLTLPDLTIGADIAIALGEAIGILLVVIVGGRYLLQPVLYRVALARSREVFTALAVLLVLGTALLTEHIGMSMAMGAFIAGLLIADSPFRHQVVAEIQPFRGLLIGLFFMSMGMYLDVGSLLLHPLASAGLLAALLAVKLVVLWPLTLLFGLRARAGAAVALLLAQSGEFGLVLFAYAREAELMSAGLFNQLLLVIVLSMLVTPLLAYLSRQLADKGPPPDPALNTAPTPAPIILAGFGRVGGRIADILTRAGRTYTAIDNNPTAVQRARDKGLEVFFGDAHLPDVLEAAGAAQAELVIVTLDDFEATEAVVSALRELEPGVTVFARGHDSKQCQRLRDLGATLAVSENLEASLELAREALLRETGDAVSADKLLDQFRRAYYAEVGKEASAEAAHRENS